MKYIYKTSICQVLEQLNFMAKIGSHWNMKHMHIVLTAIVVFCATTFEDS